ncbi:hypothetical protein BN1708_008385 [Verticillium longisporum]|uniref:Transcription factor domain-containing protein n=1 Tax=Verticillium longisporum TaxID=100787 RepID=A0A0G4N3L4_VERLO|nr:hypothetical protein BN1708_008385 [Verticillium longisporum]
MDGISAKPCMRHLTNQAFELGSAVTWMQESAVDISMLALILLVACRSLAKLQHSNVYDPIALRYKVQCLHHLNLALSHEGSDISDMTITKTLVLASEEVGVHMRHHFIDLRINEYRSFLETRPLQINIFRPLYT